MNKHLIPSWNKAYLKNCLVVKHGKNQSKVEVKNGKYQILASGGEIGRTDTFLYSKPSVLIGRKGTIDKPRYIDIPFWTVDTLFYTEIKDNSIPKFIYYVFCIIPWREYNEASGVPSLSSSTISNISILLPPLPEQKRIVSVLETWDKVIKLLEKKIEHKKNVKKALMQQLLTGKKTVEGFSDKWKVFKIGSMLKHVSIRNKNLEVSRVLSVTNRNGFVLPSDYFARRVASEDVSNYKIVHKGDFAYNPSRINVGSIARLNEYEVGILSPMYVIFRTTNLLSSDYLLYWLDTKEANNKIKNSTSGSVRDSVDFTAFSDIELRLPSPEEQYKIVSILDAFEDEITLLNQKLTSIKSQKKYLLSNLITGKIRTPENLTI